MKPRKQYLIEKLKLQPHPEGGFFREQYRSGATFPVHEYDSGFTGPRAYATGIYYLLGASDFSAFHRIKSDEIWHHYEGRSLTIHMIHEDGLYEGLYLGPEIGRGEQFQHVVPARSWFAVTVNADPESDADAYTLAGCTVAPGFDFDDFEMGDPYRLKNAFPEHADLIDKLTKS